MSGSNSLPDFAKKFRSLVDGGKRFLVLTHVRPDGDAYGCLLAMVHSLRDLKKEVAVWSEDGMVERYNFLPGASLVASGKPPAGPFDAVIVVDAANRERLGKIDLPKVPLVNIDHHGSNPGYGDLVYIEPTRASCGEVVFDLLKEAKMPVSKDIATCLYVAISTDTGSFQYPLVTPKTFRMVAELLEYGFDIGKISQLTYESHPARRLLLLKEVLQSVKFDSDDKIGYFWIDAGSYKRSGAVPDDSEGMIDHIRSIRSVRVAVLFEEVTEEKNIRISLRSKDSKVNVSDVASKFGGGGHPAAAGARTKGERADVEKRVLEAVRSCLG